MRNKFFDDTLKEMGRVHDLKNEDYAEDGNPYSNFEGTAGIAGCSVDKVFQVLIGIKMERLRQLTSGKEANFESLDDSILDLANYAALWKSWRAKKANAIQTVANVAQPLPATKVPWRHDSELPIEGSAV